MQSQTEVVSQNFHSGVIIGAMDLKRCQGHLRVR